MPRSLARIATCCLLATLLGCDESGVTAPAASDAPTEDATASTEPTTLTAGSPAPALEIEHWFPTTLDNPAPITSFESGKVYIVEFWATWCPPCVASIPHIHELQQTYGEQGVTFISVTDENVETVEGFFDQKIRGYEGSEEETPVYGELMSDYRVVSDPDGSTSEDYMEAAGQQGIPCAFLIGKSGEVEWIGHPMSLDDVLADVVADRWDREAYAEQRRLQEERAAALQAIMQPLRSGDLETAEAELETLLATTDEGQLKAQLNGLSGLIKAKRFFKLVSTDQEAAATALPKALADASGGNALMLNQFTWQIAMMAEAGEVDNADLLQAAADATESVLKEDESQASMLDTIAHLYYQKGDLDTAIAYQRRAVAASELEDDAQMRSSVEGYLEELLAEKEELLAEKEDAGDAEEATDEGVEEDADAAEGAVPDTDDEDAAVEAAEATSTEEK